MQAKGLLAATVALLLLVGGVWYSNREEEKRKGQPAADAPAQLASVPMADLREVRIDNGAEHIVMRHTDDDKYQIVEPAGVSADPAVVSQLFLDFSAVTTERIVDEKPSDLAQFGLMPPKMTVTAVRKKGGEVKLLLGEMSPTGSSTYAKLEGQTRVVTLSQMIASAFQKSLKDLRDKRLLPFDRESLKEVVVAAKGSSVTLVPQKMGWLVGTSRADATVADELLRDLDASRMDPAASEATLAEAAKAWPKAAIVGTVKVADSAGSRQMEVRREKDNVYLKSAAIDGVHKGTAALADAMVKPAADYRNKRLFDFGFDDPSRVEVKDGTTTRVLTQSDGKWSENGKALDSVSAQSLVDKLRELKAESFKPTGGGTSELDITVISNAGKRTEHINIAKSGEAYIARRNNEPEYYVLNAKAVSELRQTATDVKPAPPATPKK